MKHSVSCDLFRKVTTFIWIQSATNIRSLVLTLDYDISIGLIIYKNQNINVSKRDTFQMKIKQ